MVNESREDNEDKLVPPLRPNMLVVNADARSSTIADVDLSHSVLSRVRLFNSRLHEINLEGAALDAADLDGAIFTGCSFRAVELVNCDVERLVINGINVGTVLGLMMGQPQSGRV